MTTSEKPPLDGEVDRRGMPTVVPPTARRSGLRRRPTGAPPPLPRKIGTSGKGWLIGLLLLVGWVVVTLLSKGARRLTDQVDAAVLRLFARARTDWLTELSRAVDRVATGWTMFFAGIALLVAMIVFRRWRHLFTFLASVIVLEIFGLLLIEAYRRPRPYDVTIIGRWTGFSLPSATIAVVSFTVVGVIYALVVPGRPRTIAKGVGAVVIGVAVFARLYLGVDHPFDVLTGLAIGVAIPLLAFRFFTPNELFPVTYRRGKTAHLDVSGRRAEAIRRAVGDQLGLTVVEMKPIGLAGSGGSTPLRLRIAGDPDTFVFGKLYAMNHVRADRWYKLGRTILYGGLEDERPYQSVRRLVQHEDYAMRLLCDVGVPTAQPIGIVELTPEREYLMVSEFFDGSVEIGDAEVDDQIIDEGLALIRQLWNAGVAHRDIKPANLLVQDGHLHVIDVAFVQVRPSPWREAVDLANMMLVLAVRTDAARVYERALAFFTPDEIAEAFAATRGIASPTQLRTVMKQDGRDLLAQFRALAPERRPISLQRWGPRRILIVVGLLLAAAPRRSEHLRDVHAGRPADLGTTRVRHGRRDDPHGAVGADGDGGPVHRVLPGGLGPTTVRIRRDRARFRLHTGDHRVDVTLRPPGDVRRPRRRRGPERRGRLPPLRARRRSCHPTCG